jgi:hypothetical protein
MRCLTPTIAVSITLRRVSPTETFIALLVMNLIIDYKG